MAAKSKSFFRFSVLVLTFIGLLLAVYVVHQVKTMYNEDLSDDREVVFKSYPGFGIKIPQGFEVHGIDVSRYQKRINWKLARSMKVEDINLQFAFIKATEGTDLTDIHFKRNWRNSKQAGFVRGAYHFYRQQYSGHEQAVYFISQVKLEPGDLPPVLDVEVYTGNDVENFLAGIRSWLRVVEMKYGVKPIIYTNLSFYKKYLKEHFGDYPLWIAHYGSMNKPGLEEYTYWQHNEAGRVNGISGYVDFNVFKGTRMEFDAFRLK